MSAHPDIVFSGIGRSELGRSAEHGAGALATTAAVRAIRDARLGKEQITGLATMSGHRGLTARMAPDHHSRGEPAFLAAALGLDHLAWVVDLASGADVLASTIEARNAILAGACRNALIVTAMTHSSETPGPAEASLDVQRALGLRAPVAISALYARRYLFERGLSEQALADVVINDRRHAKDSPGALYTEVLTDADYFRSRMVADPLRVLDCDRPTNGAYAFVLSHIDDVKRVSAPPAFLIAAQSGMGSGHGVDTAWHEMPETAIAHAARGIYDAAGIGPDDVDAAQLYDGFSFFVLQWLEHLRLLPPSDLAEGIGRIRTGQGLPVNTFGGSLSHSRMHGANHLYEAIQLVRGERSHGGPRPCRYVITTFGGVLAAAAAVIASQPRR